MPRADSGSGPVPEGRDPDGYDRLRRRALWSLPTGLFVVGSRAGDRRNLMTANWVMQVATTPKLVALAVEAGSVTRRLVDEGGAFSVSVLDRSDRAVVRRFVKPVDEVRLGTDGVAESMQGQAVHEVHTGLPCLASARWWLVCEVRHTSRWDDGDGPPASHVLFVGEVVDVGEGSGGGADDGDSGILRMEDTRMNYGG